MGERGPPPTPTRILEMRGSWRAHARPHEPRPEPGAPRTPDWLDETAKLVWKQLAPRLDAAGVLSKLDGNALGRYCVLFARWKRTEEFLQKHGESHLLKDREGNVRGVKLYPQAKLATHLAEQLLRLEAHFGLTPASRARIEVPSDAAADDAKSAYLKLG